MGKSPHVSSQVMSTMNDQNTAASKSVVNSVYNASNIKISNDKALKMDIRSKLRSKLTENIEQGSVYRINFKMQDNLEK